MGHMVIFLLRLLRLLFILNSSSENAHDLKSFFCVMKQSQKKNTKKHFETTTTPRDFMGESYKVLVSPRPPSTWTELIGLQHWKSYCNSLHWRELQGICGWPEIWGPFDGNNWCHCHIIINAYLDGMSGCLMVGCLRSRASDCSFELGQEEGEDWINKNI